MELAAPRKYRSPWLSPALLCWWYLPWLSPALLVVLALAGTFRHWWNKYGYQLVSVPVLLLNTGLWGCPPTLLVLLLACTDTPGTQCFSDTNSHWLYWQTYIYDTHKIGGTWYFCFGTNKCCLCWWYWCCCNVCISPGSVLTPLLLIWLKCKCTCSGQLIHCTDANIGSGIENYTPMYFVLCLGTSVVGMSL